MKAKLKTMEMISISMIVILSIYFIHLNVSLGKYSIDEKKEYSIEYVQVQDNPQIAYEVIEEEVVQDDIVYDGKTKEELTDTIEKSLYSTIKGKSSLIVSYSLEKGVDPYMATAIILHETGCKWGCSRLVTECNNVGGQKGKGCGSYAYFNSLDEGIKAFIDNLYRNYISMGLTTPETINPKYAEDPNWAKNVSKYIEIIKAQ